MCFQCEEKYSAGHRRNQKALKIEIISEEGVSDSESPQDIMEVFVTETNISINSMAGVVRANSIRLVGKIKGNEVTFFGGYRRYS